MRKSEIEASINQNLAFEEDVVAEDKTTSQAYSEDHTSTLVISATDKNDNVADALNLISGIYEKMPNSKTKVNKTYASAK